MATPAALAAARLGRASRVAELAEQARDLAAASELAKAQGGFIAYHGTRAAPFERFDPELIGSANGRADGHGYNLTSSMDYASEYGSPMSVYVDVPKRSLARTNMPFHRDPEIADRFASAIAEAPDNQWRDSARMALGHRRGTPSMAYEDLLRAYNQEAMDGPSLGGMQADGRIVAARSLMSHGVPGFRYDLPHGGGEGFLLFPGTETRLHRLRVLDGLKGR